MFLDAAWDLILCLWTISTKCSSIACFLQWTSFDLRSSSIFWVASCASFSFSSVFFLSSSDFFFSLVVKIEFYNVSIFFSWKMFKLGCQTHDTSSEISGGCGVGTTATGGDVPSSALAVAAGGSRSFSWASESKKTKAKLEGDKRQSLNRKKRSRWPRFRGLYNLRKFVEGHHYFLTFAKTHRRVFAR
jgi:hypothetical protein